MNRGAACAGPKEGAVRSLFRRILRPRLYDSITCVDVMQQESRCMGE